MQAAAVKLDFAPDRAAIAVVILGVTAFSVAQGLTYPLISLLLDQRGVSAGLSGLNAGAFAAGLASATFAIGPLTTLARGDRLIMGGLIGCSLALGCFSIFDQLWAWFLARYALGFCASVVFMLSEAWLNTACPNRLRGRVSGIYGAGMSGGFALGPLAIPMFGTESGFAFALLAVYVALVAFLTTLLSFRTRTYPAHSSSGELLKFIRCAPILVAMVVAYGFADIAAISAMPIYFVRTGYTEAFAAFSVTAMALPTALAQPVVGWLLDKFDRPTIAVCCGLVAALSYLVLPFMASETAILVVFAIMGSAAFALFTCGLAMLGEAFTGGMLVAGSAVFALAYAVGSAMGSSALGFIIGAATPIAAPLAAGFVLLGFSAVFFFGLRKRSAR